MSSCSRHDTSELQKRGKPWELHEIQALCTFIARNAFRLFGSGGRGSLGVERQKINAWEECRMAVVAAGGRPDRSWEKIRKKWQDLASKAKKYNSQRQQQVGGTGGGGFVAPNEQYELVLQALPNELRDGIAPIGNNETAPSTSTHAPPSPMIGPSAHISVEHDKQPEKVPTPEIETSPKALQRRVIKRHFNRLDTETEDSQESQQEGKKKRKKMKKAAKKETDEVDLLRMNKQITENEKRKVEILEGILAALNKIAGCVEQLAATSLLTRMQAEQ